MSRSRAAKPWHHLARRDRLDHLDANRALLDCLGKAARNVKRHVGWGPEHLLRMTVPGAEIAVDLPRYREHHPKVARKHLFVAEREPRADDGSFVRPVGNLQRLARAIRSFDGGA